MDFDSDGTDHDDDDNLLLDNDVSIDDNEYNKTSKNLFTQQLQNQSNTQSDSINNFSDYIEIYDQIYAHYSKGEDKQWQSLFEDLLKQSLTPYELLYMFLDHTLSTSNSKKHKMLLPLIEQFKQIISSETQVQLYDNIKYQILTKLCRRCLFSQIESLVDVFNLRSIDNQEILIHFINDQIQQHQDIVFTAQMTKILQLLETDAIPLEKILLPLILKSQWETIRFVIGDDKILQKKLLKIIDDLISSDKNILRRLFTQCSIPLNMNSIDTHSLKRAARKYLKQYKFDLHDFPNLAIQEKISYIKTLFVRKYIENIFSNDEQSWNEQIKELIADNQDLKIKLVDLFVDYTDIDSAVQWACFYNLEDYDLPEQVSLRRQEILKNGQMFEPLSTKPTTWLIKQSEDSFYKPPILPSDITYIELDTDVDVFLNRLECARCDVGSNLPFVGFDCETFMDPTQRTLSSQIISILQLASLIPVRHQSLYGIFDMLALRLQFDMNSLGEFAQRIFCSQDFILLTYNYACDTSSLIENYPSMSDALMQGTAIVDLFLVQQYVIEHYPQIFPYLNVISDEKSRGLSELVRLCFGKKLDKTMQTSDWRKRPLKQDQLIYSVLDARVLVDIALFIEERTRSLKIPWSWSDFKGYKWSNKALKKRIGMNQSSVNNA